MGASPITIDPKWVVILVLLVCWAGVFDRDVWTPDEPRDAAMSLEMIRTGEMVVPHLAGDPFVEKPPLYFAVTGMFIGWLKDFAGVAASARCSTVIWGLGVLLFAGLTAFRIAGREAAFFTPAVLATMIGFVENFHWIRVDAALAFFVMLSVWSLLEGVTTSRPGFYLVSGVGIAGAFLSKGFIGPILVAIPAVGLAAAYLPGSGAKKPGWRDALFMLSGLAVAILIIGTWVWLFRKRVDAETWRQWFWVNHFGRFSGEAKFKGHMHPGKLHYYLKSITMYCAPWMLFVWVWIVGSIRRFRKTELPIRRASAFLLIWGLGSWGLLTLSDTKRDIYLLPVMPAFALMTTLMLREKSAGWIRGYTWFWVVINLVLGTVCVFLPLVIRPFLDSIPEPMREPALTFGFRHMVCLGLLALGILAACRFRHRRIEPAVCLFVTTAVMFIGLFMVPLKMMDYQKNMVPAMNTFLDGIPREERSRIAGWNFSQTDLAMFYICGDWKVPQIRSTERVEAILAGRDAEYDSIILNQVKVFSDVVAEPYEIVLEGYLRQRSQYRGLFWIKRPVQISGKPR